MCTLTLLRRQDNGFILTFNRDEVLERSNASLQHDNKSGLIYPTDEKHGGTWLCYHPEHKRLACLLNGAFAIHDRKPPYRMSRGIVVLDVFSFPTIEDFIHSYNLEDIEPFTMILWQEDRFIEFRWDGQQKFSKLISASSSIYSSCTLYNVRDIALRQEWFDQLLDNETGVKDKVDMWQFHKKVYSPNPAIGINMKRTNGPLTVSTSQLTFEDNEFNFKYYEYQSKKTLHIKDVVF